MHRSDIRHLAAGVRTKLWEEGGGGGGGFCRGGGIYRGVSQAGRASCSNQLDLLSCACDASKRAEQGRRLTLKNSHLSSERVMFRMGITFMMELGYHTRDPSHRFSTVMFSAISST